jgi:hypothetical protein
MEFLVALAEGGKGMIRKLPEFPGLVIPLAFQFLMELAHDQEKVHTNTLLSYSSPSTPFSASFPDAQISLPIAPDLDLFGRQWDKGGGAEDENDEDDNDETNYGMGLQAVDRLASALGGKIFLGVATTALQQAFVSPDWLQRHAGLMAIGRMAEGCKKFLAPEKGKGGQLKALVL